MGVKIEIFKNKAIKKHGGEYDYSRVVYVNSYTKVLIGCKIHGWFHQTPDGHISGRGCKLCGINRKAHERLMSHETFLLKAHNIHGGKYDYSKTVYTKLSEGVIIICKIHGEFLQTPNNHLFGKGCPLCGTENSKNKLSGTIENFVERAIFIHGDKYDYSKSVYNGSGVKLDVLCGKHGVFSQTPNNHLKGHGCKKCGVDYNKGKDSSTTEEFIKKAIFVHGDKYNYTNVNYENNLKLVNITCNKHGNFEQSPSNHLKGHGCQQCVSFSSNSSGENDLFKFVSSLDNSFKQNDRTIIKPLELDMFSKKFRLAIEYNGLFYHSNFFKSSRYHQDKSKLCLENNVRLIHIFENEWLENNFKITSFLEDVILKRKFKIYGRKTEIREVSIKEEKTFLNLYHLQGYVASSFCYGLYLDGNLVQIMSIVQRDSKTGLYEIQRLCTKHGTSVLGGTEKLFKLCLFKLSELNASKIITFSDFSKFSGGVYLRLGMKYLGVTNPDYCWVKGKEVVKRYSSQKHKLIKLGFDKNMTENDIMIMRGYNKLYGAGHHKFEMLLHHK